VTSSVRPSPRPSERPASAGPLDPSAVADPYPGYREWRRVEPVHRAGERLLMLTRHSDCSAMLRDTRFGHAESTQTEIAGGRRRQPGAALTDEHGRPVRSFLGLNPPDHTRLRKLVSKAFTPRMISRLAPRIEQITGELLDAMLARERADLIESLASPLPVIVISELLNVPLADRERFTGWSHAMARGLDPDFLLPDDVREQQVLARAEFVEYFRELIARRRRAPEGDLLSALTSVCDEDDDRLTENELLATCILLLIAGHETTVNLIGNGTLALLRHPGQYARLRAEPGLLEGAVEELLRYDSPVQLTVRTALEDTEVGGTPVPRGTFVVALIGAANRDPEADADPEASTSAASPPATWPSVRASTSVSAHHWRAWRGRSPSAN
jgi:cytochrome P450